MKFKFQEGLRMNKTAIEMVIEEYEGHLERLIGQRSRWLQNGLQGSIPMLDRRIAEYNELLNRLKTPNILPKIEEQIDRELDWYRSHSLTDRLKGSKAAYEEMKRCINLLKGMESSK